MAEKVYEIESVPETPFPGEPESIIPQVKLPAGTYAPTVAQEKSFPKKRIATELLSTALNTRSRKILESFDLEQRGAMQVGNFQKGVTGDLRITPNGLTARDKAGITTFAIDGDTGDATFKGTVQAGAFIGGSSVQVNDDGITISGDNGDMTFNSEGLSTDEFSGNIFTFRRTNPNNDATLELNSSNNLVLLNEGDLELRAGGANIILGEDGSVLINVLGVSAGKVTVKKGGTTLMELDNSGNLNIKGVLSQNYVF